MSGIERFENVVSTESHGDSVDERIDPKRKEISDDLIDVLDKQPNTKELFTKIHQYFEMIKQPIHNQYREKFAKIWEGRPAEANEFVLHSALQFADLHDDLRQHVELGDFSPEEQELIVHEIDKMKVLYTARSLISFYALQDSMKTHGDMQSLAKREENSVMLRSLAELVLDDPALFAEIEDGFDKTGKKVFQDEYPSIKSGLMGLVNAVYHCRSMGYRVYYAPPAIDAQHEIDLFCVPETDMSQGDSELENFLRSDFSHADLTTLPQVSREKIVGMQVKSKTHLHDIFGQMYNDDGGKLTTLAQAFDTLQINKQTLGGVDEHSLDVVNFSTLRTVGFRDEETEAIYMTGIQDDRHTSMSFDPNMPIERDYKKRIVANIAESAIRTMKRNPGINIGYMVVNYKNDR